MNFPKLLQIYPTTAVSPVIKTVRQTIHTKFKNKKLQLSLRFLTGLEMGEVHTQESFLNNPQPELNYS